MRHPESMLQVLYEWFDTNFANGLIEAIVSLFRKG